MISMPAHWTLAALARRGLLWPWPWPLPALLV